MKTQIKELQERIKELNKIIIILSIASLFLFILLAYTSAEYENLENNVTLERSHAAMGGFILANANWNQEVIKSINNGNIPVMINNTRTDIPLNQICDKLKNG